MSTDSIFIVPFLSRFLLSMFLLIIDVLATPLIGLCVRHRHQASTGADVVHPVFLLGFGPVDSLVVAASHRDLVRLLSFDQVSVAAHIICRLALYPRN